MLESLLILLHELVYRDATVMRDHLEICHLLRVTHVEHLNLIDKRLLVHDPLGKLVVVSVNASRFLLLCWEVETSDIDGTADRRRALELMRSVRPVVLCSLFLFQSKECVRRSLVSSFDGD